MPRLHAARLIRFACLGVALGVSLQFLIVQIVVTCEGSDPYFEFVDYYVVAQLLRVGDNGSRQTPTRIRGSWKY